MTDGTFDVDGIVADARRRTGLDELGDERFRIGLGQLAETLDSHLDDDDLRAKERRQLVGWLETRLRIQDAFVRHPEIDDEEIVAPMVVTGMGRSGTSALFNLLNSDPAARALLLWETTFPDPLYDLEPGQPDPRYVAMKEFLDNNRNEEFDKIHFVGADVPEECVLLTPYSFDGPLRGWEIHLEPYRSWFMGHSLDFLYEEHRRHLKLLQWQRPGERWLIKSPMHMWDLPALLRSFPDARLVWGHRDPVAVTASMASMTESVVDMYVGPTDEAERHRLGPAVLEWYAESLERGMADRAELDPARVVDYGFKEFVSDPRVVVERIYDHFDLPMPAEASAALDAHMAEHRKGEHGEHDYDLARFGLTEADVRDRYAFHLDHPLI